MQVTTYIQKYLYIVTNKININVWEIICMFVSKIKLILMAFFMLVFLSMGAVSAADDAYAVDTPVLNDTTVELNQDISSPDNNTVQVEFMDNASSIDFEESSDSFDVNYYNSSELTFVKDLVGNYGNHTVDDLASIYNVDSSCVKNTLQLVRCGVYGTDLKDTLNHKDHILERQISSSSSMIPKFSKLKSQRHSGVDVDVAEKIMQMFGTYNVRQMTYQLNRQGIQINENAVLSTLYNIKMNERSSGYGANLQNIYKMKESYLIDSIPKLQSYIINTESITYDNANPNASNIIFTDVAKYNLNNNYVVRVVDNDGNPVTSGHVSYFVNGNLVYVSKVNENGQAVVSLNDIFKSFGQYNITCKYSDIIRKNTITIGDISLNDFFNVKTIFEGIKVYSPGETYKIKFISSNNKNIVGSQVKFSINNEIVGRSTVDENGFASFKIHYYVSSLLNSKNCFIKSELYDKSLNDYFTVSEYVTIGQRQITTVSKGSLLPKWRDTLYEVCDDGYHAYINENTYQLIQFDGNSYIVHVEKINSTQQLKDIFSKISNLNINWDITILNLNLKTYNLDFHTYSDREWDYAVKVPYGQLIINGYEATLTGNDDLNFMYICNGANVVLNHLNLKSFKHCFYNQGILYCSQTGFYNNVAYKFDVKVSGSGSVIHNFNTAEFNECTFDSNNAQCWSLVKRHMAGSILYAEPYSTTYFYHNIHTGKTYDDSIFACKYSSVIITPQKGETDWTWNHFVGESFFHPLASLTMVNPKETISKDYYSNKYNPIVFNCTGSEELVNALRSLNHNGIMGSEVIINLANGVYSISKDQANEIQKDCQSGYRGSFFSDKYSEFKDYTTDKQYYFISQGFVPITINGNGAEIKISGNDKNDEYHFAFIGKNSKVSLNNLKISNFNTAFVNSKGNLMCNNCDLSNNVIKYKVSRGDFGGVLRSYGGSSIFNHCIISNNHAGTKNTDFAYAVEGSYIEINNCKIEQSGSYIKSEDSTIKCSSDLYNNHVSASSTIFWSNDPVKELLHYEINNTNEFYSIDLSKNLADVTCIDFKCDCTVSLNNLLSNRGNIYIKSNGHNVKVDSSFNVGKNTFVCLDGFTINNGLTNNGMISFVNCALNGSSLNTMFSNNGQCSMSDCVISNNYCKNVFENKGSLTLINSTIKNNQAKEYGIIYNNGGSVVCINSTFSSNSGVDIYNFQTPNCALINCIGGQVIFEEPMAAWKLDLIKSGCLVGTVAITGGLGYGIGAALGPGIAGTLLAAASGSLVGGSIGLGYGVIESNTYHDYSHLWSNVGTFALIGFSSSMVGFSFGALKYTARHANDIDVKYNIIEEDDIDVKDNIIEENDIEVKKNIIGDDNAFPDQTTRQSSTESVKIELDGPTKKMGDEIAKEIRKNFEIDTCYDDLTAELDKPIHDVHKINRILDKLNKYFIDGKLEDLGLKTFRYLYAKYSQIWSCPIHTHNQILSRLDNFISIFSI